MKREVSLVLLALVVASCAGEEYHAVHASSLDSAAQADSLLTVQRPAQGTIGSLLQLLEKRGFHVVNRLDAPSGTYLIFKGDRQSLSSIHGEATAVGVGNVAVAESSSVERKFVVGSWFAARVEAAGDQTRVLLIGKPTVNGQELCAEAADALLKDAQYWCQDTKLNDAAVMQMRDFITGREERDVVRGILIELGR